MKSFNVLIIISISTAHIVAAIILIATTYAIAATFILTNAVVVRSQLFVTLPFPYSGGVIEVMVVMLHNESGTKKGSSSTRASPRYGLGSVCVGC